MATPELGESKGIEWMRAMGILQKHWRLSALFAGVVMLTVIVRHCFHQASL